MTHTPLWYTQEYAVPCRMNRYLLEPSGIPGHFDCCAVDIPFVFFHQNRYFMLYTGFDGIGYQSALAHSADLIHWEFYCMVTPRLEPGRWDAESTSAACILRENNSLYEIPTLRKVQGRYWLVYNSYPGTGYENGPAEIGLAWCESEDLRIWNRLDKPVFSWRQGAEWEQGGMYNTCLLEHAGRFYLFYNAKNAASVWREQIGLAVSDDLLTWHRFYEHPVIPAGRYDFSSRFCANPYIVRDERAWLCFYFGFDGATACECLAVSEDLLHWEQAPQPLFRAGKSGAVDEIHAHKPCVFFHKGILRHFYCGVRRRRPDDCGGFSDDYRGICLAASQPLHKDMQSLQVERKAW